MNWMRIWLGGLASGLVLLGLCGPTGAPTEAKAASVITPLAQRAKVRIALSPANFFPFSIIYADEKGYFKRAGLDVEIVKYTQAAVTLAPMLARGDLDLAPQTPSPSFFNLVNQGFGAKAVSIFSTSRAGRTESAWMLVMKEKAGEIKELRDLKGRTVEISQPGTTTNFMALMAFKTAGLVPGKDVTVRSSVRGGGDYLPLVRNKAQDVIGMVEPTATQLEKEGYVTRWKSLSDIAPWYQSIIMTASEKFLKENGPALRKFLEVYLLTAREINAANGEWRDDLVQVMTRWSNVSADIIKGMGGVPYVDPNGRVSTSSLERAQAIWLESGALKQQASLDALIDNDPISDVLKIVGEAR
jgi:ABC-type nitrate/sulfonate/bicarbonate transport system substrate-binding protein